MTFQLLLSRRCFNSFPFSPLASGQIAKVQGTADDGAVLGVVSIEVEHEDAVAPTRLSIHICASDASCSGSGAHDILKLLHAEIGVSGVDVDTTEVVDEALPLSVALNSKLRILLVGVGLCVGRRLR